MCLPCSYSDTQWADNAIINMFARRREPKSAFAFAAGLEKRDHYFYAALLNACAKACTARLLLENGLMSATPHPTQHAILQAQHPPYDLPREYAEHAQQIFHEMTTAGIQPNTVHFGTLMDCQARQRPHPARSAA